MSLREFWVNVRTAARMLAPAVTADSPRLNATDIEQGLRKAVIWLTPRSVEGYDESDFGFLSATERRDLSESVRHFRHVASKVDPKEPAEPSQVDEALPHFLRIVEILGGNKYADLDAFIIGKQIEQHIVGRLPDSVLELRFETGEDSVGDEGLWVWVVFRNEVATNKDILLSNVNAVRELLTDAVRQLGVTQWPYVRIRIDSDLAPPEPQRAHG